MSNAMNWVAGAAVAGALALMVQAANGFDRGPSYEMRDDLLGLQNQVAEETLHVMLLAAAVGNRLINLEQEVALLRGSPEPLGEHIVGDDLSLNRAVLLRAAREDKVSETTSDELQDTHPAVFDEARFVVRLEQILIATETKVFREEQKIQLLEDLLIENGIEYADALTDDIEQPRLSEKASLFEAAEVPQAEPATKNIPWSAQLLAETRKRAEVERQIVMVESQLARLQRVALKLDRLLVENGINPVTGGVTEVSPPEDTVSQR